MWDDHGQRGDEHAEPEEDASAQVGFAFSDLMMALLLAFMMMLSPISTELLSDLPRPGERQSAVLALPKHQNGTWTYLLRDGRIVSSETIASLEGVREHGIALVIPPDKTMQFYIEARKPLDRLGLPVGLAYIENIVSLLFVCLLTLRPRTLLCITWIKSEKCWTFGPGAPG